MLSVNSLVISKIDGRTTLPRSATPKYVSTKSSRRIIGCLLAGVLTPSVGTREQHTPEEGQE